jgi:prolyl-tRNA synthetase
MKMSQLPIKTLRDSPSDETSKNAQLLIRAGYVFKNMAGAYSYLPFGYRSLNKIEHIVRKHMNSIGSQELYMASLQPKEWWMQAGIWEHDKNDALFHLPSGNLPGTEYALASTHESNLSNIVKQYISSWKDLPLFDKGTNQWPVSLYQIQTKFRDEMRAKAGLMRGREFRMKDMYDFHRTEESQKSYFEVITQTYLNCFSELGLTAYAVDASGGMFTKKLSREFQVICSVGEDEIMYSPSTGFAANVEVFDQALEAWVAKGMEKPSDLKKDVSVEVGNIFDLGDHYTKSFEITYTDENNQKQYPLMGCHGIGTSRLLGVMTELFSDEKGLVFPESVAPFKYHIITHFGKKDEESMIKQVQTLANDLYIKHADNVLLDDRDESKAGFGQKMSDAELIGCPTIIIITPRNVSQGMVEIKDRKTGVSELVPVQDLL